MATDPSQDQGMDPAGVNLPLIGQDEIQRRRALAQAMMAKGTDYSPVQSWTQGLARLADSGVGAYENYSAAKMQGAQQKVLADILEHRFGGGSGANGIPAPASSPLPPTAPPPTAPSPQPTAPTPPPAPPAPSPESIPQATMPGVPGYSMMPGTTPDQSPAESSFASHASAAPVIPASLTHSPPTEAVVNRYLSQPDNAVPEGSIPNPASFEKSTTVPAVPTSGRAQVAQAMQQAPAPSQAPQQDNRRLIAAAVRMGMGPQLLESSLAKQFDQSPIVGHPGDVFLNRNTLQPITSVPEKAPTGMERGPGGVLENQPGYAESKAAVSEAEAKAKQISPYSQEAIDFRVDRFVAGDKSAASGFGFGVSGAAARRQFDEALAQRGRDGKISPQDLLTKQAEFKALSSAEQTAGRRSAQADMAAFEARNMLSIVSQTSKKVSRTEYPTINALIEAAQKGTGNTDVIQLGNYITSLINSYTRAINPNGVGTVEDKRAAHDMLDKAYADGQIDAALQAMDYEIQQALTAPGQTMESIRQTWGGGGLSPQPETYKPWAPPTQQGQGEWTTLPDGTKIRQVQ